MHSDPSQTTLGGATQEQQSRFSRRTFLVGTGMAVAAAAALGAVDLADHSLFERGVHRIGLAPSPDRRFPPSGAAEQSGSINSRYMGGKVGWTVSHPAGAARPSGVIFCLHGYHENHRFPFDQIHLPDAAALVGLRVAVAAVDGGADSYWHKRANGTDALSMLLLEFVPMVRAMVGDIPLSLMGWSMGGYGALLAAERAPSKFVGVAPASPALWLTPGATAPGAFDSPADFYANDVFTSLTTLRDMTVAVACGTGDPFYTATRHLVDDMDFPPETFFGPGFHDADYWRNVAPDQLRALGPTLA